MSPPLFPSPPPSLLHDSNICRECNRDVPIRLGSPSSEIPGRFYLRCVNTASHQTKKVWWHVFSPANTPSPLPPRLQELYSETFPSPFSILLQPRTTGNPPATAASKLSCSVDGCQRTRVNAKCGSRSCKYHCEWAVGCSLHPKKYSGGALPVPFPALQIASPITPRRPTQTPLNDELLPSISPESQRYLMAMTFGMPDEPFPGYEDLSAPASTDAFPFPSTSAFTITEEMWNAPESSPTVYRLTPPGPQPVQTTKPITNDVAKRPKITTQMNPTWMAEYQASSSASGVKKATRAPKNNVSSARRFFLLFWDNAEEPVSIELIQVCPDWPNWTLASLSQLSPLDDLKSIQLYSPTLRIWVNIQLPYTHSLTTDCGVLLRRKGIRGIDEQEQIARFHDKSPPRRFRQGLKEEHAILKRLVMEKRKAEVLVDSDSEVEVVAGPSQPKKQHVADATFTPTCPSSPPFLTPSNPPHHSQAHEFTASLSLSPSPFPLISPLSTPTSVTTPSPPPIRPSWPIGCYAINMMNGFARVDDLMRTKPPTKDRKNVLMDRVKTVFGVAIPYTTYRDQRTKWCKAPQALRDKVVEAGHTPSGLWGYLASHVPLK